MPKDNGTSPRLIEKKTGGVRIGSVPPGTCQVLFSVTNEDATDYFYFKVGCADSERVGDSADTGGYEYKLAPGAEMHLDFNESGHIVAYVSKTAGVQIHYHLGWSFPL